ncbi:MAG: winged helix-turn-helix domain-containing protein [Lachnospiraceae bacterium]|nr:winged helix-turn-helix domain-containing protein [Ruminococcus sp.]MCM1276802.1 winged helix-turn-helix domain-containing protein [Lachnospiraceae bacterium]
MTENLLNDTPITLESLREQFLENDFTIMPATLPENMSEVEAELYNKVIDFINDDWQETAKEVGLKRPQMCYSEDFIPEALRLRVSRIVANAIIKIVRDEKVLDNMLTTFILPQMFSPLTDLVEEIDKTGLAGDDAKELLEILKNPAELDESPVEDETAIDDFDSDNVFFDDETIEELRKEFGDEIADKAKDINLCFHADDLLKHMVELLMSAMDVQSLIEIALANPVAEDFNRNNPLNYAKRDFEKSWYHTRTAQTISLDEIIENADSSGRAEIPNAVDIEAVGIAAISAEEFLNALDETDQKIVDMLVKKFTQSEIADEVGLSQSAVSRRLKKLSTLGKDFEKNFSNNA